MKLLKFILFYINLYLSMNGSISQFLEHPKKKVPCWCWHNFCCLRKDKIGSLKAAGKILQWITNIPCVYMTGTAVSIGHWLYDAGHRMDSEKIFCLNQFMCTCSIQTAYFIITATCSLTPEMPSCLKQPPNLQNTTKTPQCKYLHILIAQGVLFKKKINKKAEIPW